MGEQAPGKPHALTYCKWWYERTSLCRRPCSGPRPEEQFDQGTIF